MKRNRETPILCNAVARLERSRGEAQAVKKPGKRLHLWPITLGLLMAVTVGLSAMTQAAVYYVDPAGGNDSAGGSASNPWRTINKAKSTVNAGDIVNLMPGNYGTVTFTSSDRRGTSNNYITYRNNPDSSPYSARFSRIFFSGNTNFYIAVEGFDVENTGSDDACIKVEYGSYVDIIDCKVHGKAGGSGPSYANIFIRAADNILIEGCEVYYTGGSAHAIQLESCDTITVRKCHVHDTISSGIRTGGGQNYVIEYNVIHDQRADWNPSVHGSGISIHSHNTVIRGNIVYNYGNTRPIRFYQDWAGPDGYRNMLVENNLVYRTSDFTGTQWWPEFIDVGPNCVIRNNTFVDDVTITFASNADGSGLAIYNNIVTGRFQLEDHGNWQRVSEGGNIFGRLGASGCGWVCFYDEFSPTSNSIVGADFGVGTFFNSASAHYPYSGEYPYQLSRGSIAIDFDDDNMSPETDLLQKPRVGRADAGCFEYGASATNRPPTADAGVDQTVVDTDNNGSELVALDGAASTDTDGQIVSYLWTRDSAEIAVGVDPTVELSLGQHAITLTVTDNEGRTDTDTVIVTVQQTDDGAPSVLSVTSTVNSVTVTFNEAVEPSSAEDINNYHIDNDISIISARVDGAGDRVVLTTSSQIAPAYTLTCGSISDLSGNLMASTTVPYYNSALKAFWKFNEQSGSVVADSSENGNTGALVNGPQWTEYGALMFDGVDDYVNCGADSSLNLTGGLTISACVNPAGFGQNGWGRIVDKGNGSTGFSLFVEESNWSLVYVIYGGSLVRSDPNVISLDKWQHVAVVYDNAKHTVDFYVDGQPAGSSTYTTPALDSSNSRLNVGIRGHDLNRAFDGMISAVRLYNSPLGADDILALFGEDYPFTLYPVGDKEVDENANLNFTIKTIVPDVDVAINEHNLPGQPTLANKVFNWTPTYDDAGEYETTFVAGYGLIEDFETITITVNNVNRQPVLSPIGNKTVDAGCALTFNLDANDPDGEAVIYSAQNLPKGSKLIGNTFSWTPANAQAGDHKVTFAASDGQSQASETITITVTEITQKSDSLVGRWRFDELNGDIANDYSSMNNAGKLVNGPVWATGKLGGALRFNGQNSHVDCGVDPSLNLTGSLTITAWINPADFGQNGWGRIVDKGDASAGFSFFINERYNRISYVIYGGRVVSSDSNVIEAGKWRHVAVVYDEAADTVAFYVDGREAGTVGYTTPPVAALDQKLVIGIRASDGQRAFDGLIDEVCIYNDALTAQEIQQDYAAVERPVETIIDNGDPATSSTGEWAISGGANPYGLDSFWSRDGSTYTWTFTPETTGSYTLSMRWSQWPSRSVSVPVVINHEGGADNVVINQLENAGQWNVIGRYFFSANTSYAVTITSQPAPTSTCADAIRFTP